MIKTKSIPVYYLNPDSFRNRRERMDKFISDLGFEYFERSPSNSTNQTKQIRVNEGFVKLAETAITRDKYPFLILEDDANLIIDIPENISIPPEALFIYWGASLWECGGVKPPLRIENYNDNYYRLYHSLACHAIIVPNKNSAEYFIKINNIASKKLDQSDIWFAVDSKDKIYLTPKNGPYIYQDDAHTKPITNFLWENLKNTYLK